MALRIIPVVFLIFLLPPAQAQMVQKCCGTSNSTFLLGNLTTASHSQSIYTPADLTAEGSLRFLAQLPLFLKAAYVDGPRILS